MEPPEAVRQRVRRATTRLADAERERTWGIVAAKEAGLSIRQTASATGLSPTHVYQLRKTAELAQWQWQRQQAQARP
jgi:hypothetical protein